MLRVLLFSLMMASLPLAARAQDIVTVPDIPASEGEEIPLEQPPASAAKPKPEPEMPPPAPDQAAPLKPFNAVRVRGLDKVTARTSLLEAPLGTIMRFGNLEIIARKCWQSAPEDQPEAAALLEIRELKPGEGPVPIFAGWMFASSPGLSSLEHPVYDITMLSCATRDFAKEQE